MLPFLISFSSNCARLRRNKVSLALNARGSFGHPPVSLWSPSGPLLVSRRSPLHYTQKSLSANIPVRISSRLNLLPRTVHSYGAGTRRLPTGIFAPRGRLLVSVDILRCVFYHGVGHAGASGYYEYASISCMHHWPYAGDQAAKRWYSSVSVWLVSLILKLESVRSHCRGHASGRAARVGFFPVIQSSKISATSSLHLCLFIAPIPLSYFRSKAAAEYTCSMFRLYGDKFHSCSWSLVGYPSTTVSTNKPLTLAQSPCSFVQY